MKLKVISQGKNSNQLKINVFFIIFKIYWSVKSEVLMETPSRSAELLIFDLELLIHRTVALISEKLSLALIQYIIVQEKNGKGIMRTKH